MEWNEVGAGSEAVDGRQCGLFAIAEERSPDVIREAHEQSWTEEENHLEVMADEDREEDERPQTVQANEVRSEYGQLLRSDEMLQLSEHLETPSTAENHLETEEAKPSPQTTSEEVDQRGSDDEASTVFNYVESDSVGVDGLSVDNGEEIVNVGEVSDEYTNVSIDYGKVSNCMSAAIRRHS